MLSLFVPGPSQMPAKLATFRRILPEVRPGQMPTIQDSLVCANAQSK